MACKHQPLSMWAAIVFLLAGLGVSYLCAAGEVTLTKGGRPGAGIAAAIRPGAPRPRRPHRGPLDRRRGGRVRERRSRSTHHHRRGHGRRRTEQTAVSLERRRGTGHPARSPSSWAIAASATLSAGGPPCENGPRAGLPRPGAIHGAGDPPVDVAYARVARSWFVSTRFGSCESERQ